MSNERRGRPSVGDARDGRRLPPVMVLALSALAVSVLVFIAVVAGVACGDDDDGGTGPVAHLTATNTARPSPGETPTQPATGAPTEGNGAATSQPSPTSPPATSQGGGNGAATATPDGILLPCGDILVPLDKQHRLGADCAPPLQQLPASITQGGQSLRPEAAQAVAEMLEAAADAGHAMAVVSSYRSYQYQVDLYNYYVNTIGPVEAARTSARAGHSEHQLGTTADISSASVGWDLLESFGDTPEGRWLADNGWRYGFIVSYPAGKEGITGYAYEPWHVRYVGRSVAADVRNSGLTLHEYLLR